MKSFLKIVLALGIGFLVGFLIIELLYGNVTALDFSNLYFWLSILLLLLSVGLIIFVCLTSNILLKKNKQQAKNLNEDDLDRFKYNTFNQLTAASTTALVMSLVALAIQILNAEIMWLIITSGIIFTITVILSIFVGGIINSLYPERNLPNPSDKDYADKLFEASDDGEIHVMAKGLYRSTQLTMTLLFISMVAMILYSIITEDSQVFSIIIIGLIMIINQVKYAKEIKER
ncbi:DUF3169 family protein [Jeotgalicoccus meleagridis]|uniref:DUF3169 family protein n=1 Tax=Jeotgalicoccus meleagridis TaxID=2759181 RepID=A0A6V7R1T9_9STAP|nr:DUF3169 family protein [Jeotgalicoccus meleagridis]CAD2071185.1 hypothetical protein JEODO184_00157 [Jeotgalicoccus meleagridis]